MATLTLYPNGAGSTQGWDAEGGDYQKIDETSSDGDTTRLYSPTANAIADFDLQDPTTEEGVINSVTVYIYTRGLDPVSNVVQLLVRLSSTNYLSADKTYNNTSYHDESNTWSTNPATSAAWTWAEVAALRAGMKRISGGGQAVTQLRVVVDYTPATYEQEGFRFFNNDGDEDASTGLAAQDTNVTQPEGTITRLRMLINTSGQTDPRKYILYFKKSTDGTYIKVPTSGTAEAFTIAASAHITASGDPTTARLTAPSGKSTSDFDAGRISDDENPSDSVTVSADDYTEMEWSLVANAAAVDGGVYQFRVYKYLETYGTELTTGGTASALGENGPNETAAKAFDDDSATKWLHFTGSATWLKYDLGSGVTKLVTKYALTSANDADTRDPKDWELQGSNDNSAWTTVDTVTGETFASRGLRKEFVCDTPGTTAYRYWRLYINANNGNGSITQLAEVQLYQLSDPLALDTYTVTPEWTIGTATTTYTVTATAKARIKKLAVTATATAKARVKGLGVTKTVTAKARIKNVATATVTAKGRVKNVATQTVTAKTRVKGPGITKTVTAKARVKQVSVPQTVTAKATIQSATTTNTATTTAKARVKTAGTTVSITAKARVKLINITKTATSKARVKLAAITKTLTSKARVKTAGTTVSVTSKARVKQASITTTVTAKSRVKRVAEVASVTAKTRVKSSGVIKTVQAMARVKQQLTVSVYAKARVLYNRAITVTSKARVRSSGTTVTISAKARIKRNAATVTVSAKANIFNIGRLKFYRLFNFTSQKNFTAQTGKYTNRPVQFK